VAKCLDYLRIVTVYLPDEDEWINCRESAKMIPDTCSCGKGRLKKGTTDFTVRVEGEIIVIRDVPAYVCDSCSEAYFSIETSRKIDEIMREFHAGRLLTKPLRAGEVELKMSASS